MLRLTVKNNNPYSLVCILVCNKIPLCMLILIPKCNSLSSTPEKHSNDYLIKIRDLDTATEIDGRLAWVLSEIWRECQAHMTVSHNCIYQAV